MRHSEGSKAMLASIIDEYVSPLLSSKGFRRSKLVWNRRLNGITHVLDMQLSKWSDAESISFTVNLGVWIEHLWQIYWDKKNPPATIPESECFPSLRVGQLLGEGPLHKDVWWTVKDPNDVSATGSELRDILTTKCIPFLDKLSSIDTVLAVMEDPMLRRFPGGRLSYAVLKYLAGQRADATEILAEMLANPKLKAWHDRIRGVSERLARFG